jgi:hypothetical protein
VEAANAAPSATLNVSVSNSMRTRSHEMNVVAVVVARRERSALPKKITQKFFTPKQALSTIMANPIAPRHRADRFRTSTHADLPQTKYDVNDPLGHTREQQLKRLLQSPRFGYSTSPALDNLLVDGAVARIIGAMTAPPPAVAALADLPLEQTLLVVNADMMDIISKLAPVIYAKLVPLLVIINTDNKKWTVVNAVELYAVCKGAVPGVNPHSVPQDGALLGMMDGGCMNGDGGFQITFLFCCIFHFTFSHDEYILGIIPLFSLSTYIIPRFGGKSQ